MNTLILPLSLLFLLVPKIDALPGPKPVEPLPDEAPWDSREDPDVRLSFTPLVGSVGGLMGAAFDVGMGYKSLAWGLRAASGSEFCLFCGEPETESQLGFLLGVRHEFDIGVLSLKSGITKVERTTRGKRLDDGEGMGFFSSTEHEMRNYEGIGVPLQFDLVLGGRYIGVDFSMTFLQDDDGGSTSVLIGLPFGLLRL